LQNGPAPAPSQRRGKLTYIALAGGAALVIAFAVHRGLRSGNEVSEPATSSFASASVEPSETDGRSRRYATTGGRVVAEGVPLKTLIALAHDLQEHQVVDAPAWTQTTRFDVVADSGSAETPQDELQRMLRELLAQRFGLATHRERRKLPGYALVVADTNSGPGAGLVPVDVECGPGCSVTMQPGRISSSGFPLQQAAGLIEMLVQRPMEDRTELTGNFSIDVTWSPDPMPLPENPEGTSIGRAFRERLGLALEAAQIERDVLVIDAVSLERGALPGG
jgi:uncharacterized protein (TIGR03435 family)